MIFYSDVRKTRSLHGLDIRTYKIFFKNISIFCDKLHKEAEITPNDIGIRQKKNANENVVKKILTAGQAGLVCESNRIGSRKQKPAGNREGVLPTA